jgi:hypothetical protein
MGGLREQIAQVRRARREIRARLYAKWDEEGRWRRHWWDPLIVWGGAALGIYLILWGDDTVERAFGVGLVTGPAMLATAWAGMWAWALWTLRRKRAPMNR